MSALIRAWHAVPTVVTSQGANEDVCRPQNMNSLPKFPAFLMRDSNGIKQGFSIVRRLFSDILIITGLVTAFSFFEWFNSKASIEFELFYYACHYNTIEIVKDFKKHNAENALKLYFRLSPSLTIVGSDSEYVFSKDHPIPKSLDLMDIPNNLKYHYDDLKEAIKYQFKERVGDFKAQPEFNVINTAFWEKAFVDSLALITDSISFCKTLSIIIAHREINTWLFISNKGDLAAKNIMLYLRPPMLLQPRGFITNSRVEFLDINPKLFNYDIGSSFAKIEIPYMKPNQEEYFSILSSLTNVTKENVFIDFETEKNINVNRALRLLAIIGMIYILLAIIITVMRFAIIRIKMKNI